MSSKVTAVISRVERREQAAEWLLRLRDPQIAPDEVREWLTWCEASAENTQEFSQMQAIWQQSSGLNKHPDFLPEALLVERDTPKSGSRYRQWALAAAFGAVAVTASIWFLARTPPSHSDVTIATTIGVNREVILPDGTAVTVAAGSRLETEYTASERRIRLEGGEAYFRVKKDRNRPFVVAALNTTVTAVGTAFNVRAEQGIVKVAVTEGIVDVDRRSNAALNTASSKPAENIRLIAGHQVMLTPSDPEPIVVSLDTGGATAWTDGTLQFMREPLSSVIAAVNRYSAVPIRLNDEKLGSRHYTGTVAVERVDDWLRGLPDVFAVSIRRDDDKEVIIEATSAAKGK